MAKEYRLTGTVTNMNLQPDQSVRATISVKDGERDASYFYLITNELTLGQPVEVIVHG